ncbi:MAG: hypothetical protein LBK63_10395 [Treponema sp.]|nr:hypothetical protein [Treponema sp.]
MRGKTILGDFVAVKLNPEFPERRTLNHILRSPEGEIVNTIRPDAAKAGSLRQTALSPALFKELALSLGLPRDTLSAALLSLAKFFSLPLDAKLIRQLRRQALSLPVPEPPSPEGARVPARPNLPLAGTIRSAALAAAAAAGKGVALSPEALGGYAAALAAGLAVNLRDETEDEPGTEGGDMPEGPKDGPPPFDDSHVLVEGIEGRLPLLGVLNRIPGKDGRRWIALPFSFRSGDLDYHVSLRIVLADTNSIPWKAERMALDIKTFRRRWSFMLENPAGKEGRFFGRAVFGAQPALNPKAERGLRKLLGSIAGKTVLRDISGGAFPEEEWGAGQWEP